MKFPDNIKEIVGVKPDFLGLIFYPESKRFVTDSEAIVINEVIPESIKKVGVFVNADFDVIAAKLKLFNLNFVQLHGCETPELCENLKNEGVIVIKAFGVGESFDFAILKPYLQACDYFLFDTKSEKHGGTGIKFNWEILNNYKYDKPFFLSGGIGPDDAEGLKELNLGKLYSLDINSRFETEPAKKDVNLLGNFISEYRK
ncbi:MAG: phosphoribosylanthranilate isomerase [Bacteroidales bacterium]|nr:phosphoribosylanthranilate isomerase [Bacteroidales bacterium]MBN2818080.1 phosphoribosylanthranilate isomerase [Bacteroidales bacterium]